MNIFFFESSKQNLICSYLQSNPCTLGIIELLETKNSPAICDFTYIHKAKGNVRSYKVLLAIFTKTLFFYNRNQASNKLWNPGAILWKAVRPFTFLKINY